MKSKFSKKFLSSLLGTLSLFFGNFSSAAGGSRNRWAANSDRGDLRQERKSGNFNENGNSRAAWYWLGGAGILAAIASVVGISGRCSDSNIDEDEIKTNGSKRVGKQNFSLPFCKNPKLLNDYSAYISNRELSNEEKNSLQNLANKFGMVPWLHNNCWASVNWLVLSDFRDIEQVIKDSNGSDSFRISEINKRLKKFLTVMDNPAEKKKLLESYQNDLHALFGLPNNIGNKKSEDIYSEIGKDTKFNPVFRGISDISSYAYSNDCDSRVAFRSVRQPNLDPKISASDKFCLGENGKIVDKLNLLSMKSVGKDEIQLFRDREFFKRVKKDRFWFELCREDLSPNSELNIFGRVDIKGDSDEGGSACKSYLPSDVTIHTGNHWYYCVLVYDRQTLDSETPKILAAIKFDNMREVKILRKDNLLEMLESISFNYGQQIRYREIDKDNKSILSV